MIWNYTLTFGKLLAFLEDISHLSRSNGYNSKTQWPLDIGNTAYCFTRARSCQKQNKFFLTEN